MFNPQAVLPRQSTSRIGPSIASMIFLILISRGFLAKIYPPPCPFCPEISPARRSGVATCSKYPRENPDAASSVKVSGRFELCLLAKTDIKSRAACSLVEIFRNFGIVILQVNHSITL